MHTQEDGRLFNEVTALTRSLWASSSRIEGLSSDPKMISIMLYRRLWSHQRAFALLYNQHLNIDADNAVRGSIEAAICVAANFHQDGGFWHQLRLDAVKTLTGQITMFRELGIKDLEREAEAQRRDFLRGLPEGSKGEQLKMEGLAKIGQVPQLYSWYRQISAISTHVTGMSILRGVVPGGSPDVPDPIVLLTRRLYPFWQIGAAILASRLHARMIEDSGNELAATDLAKRLDSRSAELWGNDGKPDI